MKINEAFPSNYLKASDLGESQPVVVIESVKVEPVGRNKEMKPVLYFEGKTKGIVLNKTNAKAISAIVGSDDTDDWMGCKIRLYATEVEFQGETVDAIRVKAPAQVPKVKLSQLMRDPANKQVDAKPKPQPEPEHDFEAEVGDVPF